MSWPAAANCATCRDAAPTRRDLLQRLAAIRDCERQLGLRPLSMVALWIKEVGPTGQLRCRGADGEVGPFQMLERYHGDARERDVRAACLKAGAFFAKGLKASGRTRARFGSSRLMRDAGWQGGTVDAHTFAAMQYNLPAVVRAVGRLPSAWLDSRLRHVALYGVRYHGILHRLEHTCRGTCTPARLARAFVSTRRVVGPRAPRRTAAGSVERALARLARVVAGSP